MTCIRDNVTRHALLELGIWNPGFLTYILACIDGQTGKLRNKYTFIFGGRSAGLYQSHSWLNNELYYCSLEV